MSYKLIVNSSMPRSGSQLVQCILNQNPRFFATGTSSTLPCVVQMRKNYFEQMDISTSKFIDVEKAFLDGCNGFIYSYYKYLSKPVVFDKFRGGIMFYNFLKKLNKDQKIICCVRDLRSVLCSFEKIFNNSIKPDPAENTSINTHATIDKRINFWLNDNPLGTSLERLYNSLETGTSKNFLFLRYEDLCYSPQAVMDSIHNYIDEPLFNYDFNNIVQINEDDSYHSLYGEHTVGKTIKFSEPNYESVLGKYNCEFIKEKYKWFFDTFHYS